MVESEIVINNQARRAEIQLKNLIYLTYSRFRLEKQFQKCLTLFSLDISNSQIRNKQPFFIYRVFVFGVPCFFILAPTNSKCFQGFKTYRFLVRRLHSSSNSNLSCKRNRFRWNILCWHRKLRSRNSWRILLSRKQKGDKS